MQLHFNGKRIGPSEEQPTAVTVGCHLTGLDLNIEQDNFMKFVSFQSPNTWSDTNLVLFIYINFKHFQMFLITYIIRFFLAVIISFSFNS